MDNITLITIGSDRTLADPESKAALRARQYKTFCREMHIIVFSLRAHGVTEREIAPGLFVHPTNSWNRLLYIADAIRIGKKIAKVARVAGPCIVSTQDPFEAGFVGYIISKKNGIPLHIQIHTDIGSTFFRKQSVLNKIRFFIATRFVLKQAKSVRVVSPSIKKYLIETCGMSAGRITVLPIVDDFKPIHRGEPQEHYVLMVSRLEKEKQIDRALQIFKKVLVHKPNLTLKIAGSGREEGKLKKVTKELGIENSVEFLGNVKNTASLYAHASCLLHISLYEGFGMVLYEAMVSGCPIVTTPVGIASDLKEQGYAMNICNSGDGECMQEAIRTYTDSFETSHPVNLDFVADSQEEYLELYRQSIIRTQNL